MYMVMYINENKERIAYFFTTIKIRKTAFLSSDPSPVLISPICVLLVFLSKIQQVNE